MNELNLLRLQNLTILQQLQIEEALLRLDKRNWCLLHCGASPAIVMGISGERSTLVDEEERCRQSLPLIRRFSGGGTVVIDENSCFITVIANNTDVAVAPFPQAIARWNAALCAPLFAGLSFHLCENDYAIGEKKCGGNAQYITRDRWLHHTSFLWDFSLQRMAALKVPSRAPQYRQQRSHEAFLCRLSELLPHYISPSTFLDAFEYELGRRFPTVTHTLEHVRNLLNLPHRRSTVVL